MAISNYAELKAAVADFLNRDDLTSVIPNFIALAEADIARKVRHWRQHKRVSTDVDQRYEHLPTDFLEVIRIQLDDYSQLRPISSDEMAQMRSKYNNTAGTPKFYYLTANQLEFYPSPDQTYSISMLYSARVPNLSDTDDTNWLLTQNPDILLYGSLVQSAPYLQNDERVAVWGSMYTNGIESLNRDSMRSSASGGALVMRPR